MKASVYVGIVVLCSSGIAGEKEQSSIRAYVDSDICARLMLGPITEPRIECSKTTEKDGAEPVLVRLQNNMVFTVNKQKMIRPLVGQLAEVYGEPKPKNGTMKLQEVKPLPVESIAS